MLLKNSTTEFVKKRSLPTIKDSCGNRKKEMYCQKEVSELNIVSRLGAICFRAHSLWRSKALLSSRKPRKL